MGSKRKKGKRRKRNRKERIKYFILGLLTSIVGIFLLNDAYGWEVFPSMEELYQQFEKRGISTLGENELQAHFIDVGQGDSTLIQSKGMNILVDGGDVEEGVNLVGFLSKQGVKELDLVILTHPHADHIGGVLKVIESIPIKKVMLPKVPNSLTPTSSVYENLLLGLGKKNIPIWYPKYGESYDIPKGKLIFYPPENQEYDTINNYSIVVRVEYGNQSILITGDLEKEGETELLDKGANVNVDVLKVGHHGSQTSSRQEFLSEVEPKYAVISSGKGNRYGHPHEEVVKRLKKFTPNLLRSDEKGTITITLKGQDILVSTEKGG